MKILVINNKKIYETWASKTYEYKMNKLDNDDRFLHISIDDLKNNKYTYEELLNYDIMIFGWNSISISKYYTTKHKMYKKIYNDLGLDLENKDLINELIEPLMSHQRKYYIVQDLHDFDCLNGTDGLNNYLNENKFSGIITPYKCANEIPKLKNLEILHLPHHIDENKFKDFHLEKEYDIFIFGNTNRKWYPFRNRITHLLKNIGEKHNLKVLHWENGISKSYFDFESAQQNCNENLSKAINKSWLTLCTTTKWNWLVGKYFETSFSNSVIIGDMPEDGHEIWKNNLINIDQNMDNNTIEKIVLESLNNKELLNEYSSNCLEIMKKYYLCNYTNNLYNLFN